MWFVLAMNITIMMGLLWARSAASLVLAASCRPCEIVSYDYTNRVLTDS